MRTLDSWRGQEAKLRARHTQQTQAGEWVQAQTTRQKLKMVLDAIHELEHAADKLIPKPRE